MSPFLMGEYCYFIEELLTFFTTFLMFLWMISQTKWATNTGSCQLFLKTSFLDFYILLNSFLMWSPKIRVFQHIKGIAFLQDNAYVHNYRIYTPSFCIVSIFISRHARFLDMSSLLIFETLTSTELLQVNTRTQMSSRVPYLSIIFRTYEWLLSHSDSARCWFMRMIIFFLYFFFLKFWWLIYFYLFTLLVLLNHWKMVCCSHIRWNAVKVFSIADWRIQIFRSFWLVEIFIFTLVWIKLMLNFFTWKNVQINMEFSCFSIFFMIKILF